jgi:heat shock protein HslJ
VKRGVIPLCLAGALACAGAAHAAPELLHGRLGLPPGTELPAAAMLRLELFDTSQAPARRLVVLEQPAAGRPPPLAFVLPYESPAAHLALRAVVYADGQVLFTSGGAQPLAGAVDTVELAAGAAAERTVAATLDDTDWQLVDVGGVPVRTVAGERTAYMVLLDGLLTGGSGCNKLLGDYSHPQPGVLRFGRVAGTRMACPPALQAQEAALFDALARTDAYRIEDRTLTLLAGEQVLARFFARSQP